MANRKKSVSVGSHKRSTPSRPAHDGPGKKPGPKPVSVERHKRRAPKR